METFSALLAICEGNSPVSGEFPTQRPVTRNFDVFFDLRQNERLSKHSWGWWLETLSRPSWRHINGLVGQWHRLKDRQTLKTGITEINVMYMIAAILFQIRKIHGRLCKMRPLSWWRHQIEIFSASLTLCVGNLPVTDEFPAQRPVTRDLDVFFDLCLNKWLSKRSWGWWFETPSHPLWRHCNGAHYTWTLATWLWNHEPTGGKG